jgi:pyruvate-formate lyase-activating enzyme
MFERLYHCNIYASHIIYIKSNTMATQFLIGCVWSCLGCCAKEIHQACANLVGVEVITKFYYLMLDVMVIIPSLLMFYYIDEWSWFVKSGG